MMSERAARVWANELYEHAEKAQDLSFEIKEMIADVIYKPEQWPKIKEKIREVRRELKAISDEL